MDFAAYIKSQPRGTMTKLAEVSGVTYQSIKNIRIGRVDKFKSWDTAFALWKACKGKVGMKDLLVNWADIKKVIVHEAKLAERAAAAKDLKR